MKCDVCKDTGVIETGNNDLPCTCEFGKIASFNVGFAGGPVTGQEVLKHFLNHSPEPLNPSCGFFCSKCGNKVDGKQPGYVVRYGCMQCF